MIKNSLAGWTRGCIFLCTSHDCGKNNKCHSINFYKYPFTLFSLSEFPHLKKFYANFTLHPPYRLINSTSNEANKNQEKIKINIVSSDYFSKEYFAKRPKSERLINYRLNLLSLNIMRNWKTCLVEYLKKDFSEFFK